MISVAAQSVYPSSSSDEGQAAFRPFSPTLPKPLARAPMPHLLPTTLILLAAATAAQAQPPAQTVDTVLAANRAAVGNVPAAGGVTLDYDWSGSGLTGTRNEIADLATGAFVGTEQAGEIGDVIGYDGAVPWQRDLSGANTAQQGGDRIPVAVNEAYRTANAWW